MDKRYDQVCCCTGTTYAEFLRLHLVDIANIAIFFKIKNLYIEIFQKKFDIGKK